MKITLRQSTAGINRHARTADMIESMSSDCMGSQENVETHFNQPREQREPGPSLDCENNKMNTTETKHTPWSVTVFGPTPENVYRYRIESAPAYGNNFATQHVEKETRGKSPATLSAFRQIAREHNERPQLLAALNPFAALTLEQCPTCDGSGLRRATSGDACGTCGGTGELVSSVHPNDVKQARAAIRQATGGTR